MIAHAFRKNSVPFKSLNYYRYICLSLNKTCKHTHKQKLLGRKASTGTLW